MKLNIVLILIILTFQLCGQTSKPEFESPVNVLVFSKTNGYRHQSISSGVKMLYDLSFNQNWILTTTENNNIFTDELLSTIDVIVFLNPSGATLTAPQKAAFEKYIQSGKGMVGIHAAADFEYEWPFYGKILGAWFKNHPPAQEATVRFENHDHPAMLPFKNMKSYTTTDEWYTFKSNPRNEVNVVATLDERSITKYNNDDWRMEDHPIIWWQELNGARSFYTGFGHTHEAYEDEKISEHIKQAINWAAKRIN